MSTPDLARLRHHANYLDRCGRQSLATELRDVIDRLELLTEFLAAHDDVEDLIADGTDDRDAYNAAVSRAIAARQAIATADGTGT